MIIKIKCGDCKRIIGSFVHKGGKDVEIEVHACFHKKLYQKKKAPAALERNNEKMDSQD